MRKTAAKGPDAKQAWHILTIAMVLDGFSRDDAAQVRGMDRRPLRDWAHRYDEAGLSVRPKAS